MILLDRHGNPISVVIPSMIGMLHDVDVSSTLPADGNTLVWVDADKKWEPGVSGVGPLAPNEIVGLRAWWKADALGLSNGANVNTWTDSSGNGHTLTGGTTKPTFASAPSGFNGEPAVQFVSGTNAMTAAFAASLNPPAMTVAMVMQLSNTVNSQVLLADLDSLGNGWDLQYVGSSAGGPFTDFFTAAAGSGIVDESYGPAVPHTAGATYVFVMTAPSGSSPTLGVYRDHVLGTTQTSGTAWVPAANGTLNLGTNGVSNHLTAYVAEIALWDWALGGYDRAALGAYFKNKYATA